MRFIGWYDYKAHINDIVHVFQVGSRNSLPYINFGGIGGGISADSSIDVVMFSSLGNFPTIRHAVQ